MITPNSSNPGNVTVILGQTRVQACVSCEVTQPRPHRPTDGQLFFNVTLSPMGSPAFEIGGRSSPIVTETARILERCFKESKAVDTESLCIIAGQKVWSVRVDIHVLDYCGNIIDCSALAAITALKGFRRPDVTVVGEKATIHPISEREPVPLSIHHMPLCISFAFFHNGEYLLVDPSHEEEYVMEGRLIIAMNIHKEICTLQLTGGVTLLQEQVLRCVQIASVKIVELSDIVKQSLNVSNDISGMSVLVTAKDDESIDINKIQENKSDIEMESTDIIILGDNTSQLICKTLLVDSEDEEHVEPKHDKEMGDNDSEEDMTVTVTEEDIGGFIKSHDRSTGEGNSHVIDLTESTASTKRKKRTKAKRKK